MSDPMSHDKLIEDIQAIFDLKAQSEMPPVDPTAWADHIGKLLDERFRQELSARIAQISDDEWNAFVDLYDKTIAHAQHLTDNPPVSWYGPLDIPKNHEPPSHT